MNARTEENNWALVTGGSSGIGAAIAERLAQLKWNIVLVGRDVAALEAQAAALEKNDGVETLAIVADLSTPSGIERVRQRVTEKTLPIRALVNNAGFGLHNPFIETNGADEARMIDLQLKTMIELTKAFLPGMTAAKSGRILNVASVYAFSPVPNQAVYAACKAFMLSFSRTLALELHGTGVTISVLCPGITLTKFRASAGMQEKKSAFAMSAEAVAKIGVRGMLRGKATIVPGWHNTLYTLMARCVPAEVLGQFTRWFNRRRGLAEPIGVAKMTNDKSQITNDK
jgi:short-subunit dehydrogenase